MSDHTSWLSQQRALYQRKLSAWNRAKSVFGYDAVQYRQDAHGSWIAWSEYGQHTQYGWEIDHELPKAHFPGVVNHPGNLRALHWRNNRAKSDKLDLSTIVRLLGGVQS